MKKARKLRKIHLSRETLLHLQDPRDAKVVGGNTGPSCDIFRACTIAGWDC